MLVSSIKFQAVSEKFPELYAKWIEIESAGLCMSPSSYENLVKNMSNIIRYINQLHALIEAYEEDADKSNEGQIRDNRHGHKELVIR